MVMKKNNRVSIPGEPRSSWGYQRWDETVLTSEEEVDKIMKNFEVERCEDGSEVYWLLGAGGVRVRPLSESLDEVDAVKTLRWNVIEKILAEVK